MNKVILIGRLTQDPGISYTSQNTPFCRFSLAIGRPKKQDGTQETDFINCTTWNKQAENLCQYQSKGSLISVEGNIRTEKYQDKEGNTRTATYVLANQIQFLGSKGESTNEPQQEVVTPQREEQTDVFSDFGDLLEEDDNFLE